uniref:Uncharacterized protein n=1 Tax=Cacopsylla melanoneura TaxID=428564 RepID=A0A8D9F2K5_9HEMI
MLKNGELLFYFPYNKESIVFDILYGNCVKMSFVETNSVYYSKPTILDRFYVHFSLEFVQNFTFFKISYNNTKVVSNILCIKSRIRSKKKRLHCPIWPLYRTESIIIEH